MTDQTHFVGDGCDPPHTEPDHPCDVTGCDRPAVSADIGEGGDLWLCDDHYHPRRSAVMADTERLAWDLCDAETPLTGRTKFDMRPCPRHLTEAAAMHEPDERSDA